MQQKNRENVAETLQYLSDVVVTLFQLFSCIDKDILPTNRSF